MFDGRGCSGQHAVSSAGPRDGLVRGARPRQRQTKCSRRPIAKRWQYQRARLAGVPSFFSHRAIAVCTRAKPSAIAASGEMMSRAAGNHSWSVVDVALGRRDKRAMETSGEPALVTLSLCRGLADLLLVRPLEQPVADVPELQVELVVRS